MNSVYCKGNGYPYEICPSIDEYVLTLNSSYPDCCNFEIVHHKVVLYLCDSR